MEYRVPVIVEPLEEGGYYAECPILPGCHVEGTTYLEALGNLEDAIRLHIEGRLEFGDQLPSELTPVHQIERFSLQLPVTISI
jgi:predicted RNase H-like HicB family nuclease